MAGFGARKFAHQQLLNSQRAEQEQRMLDTERRRRDEEEFERRSLYQQRIQMKPYSHQQEERRSTSTRQEEEQMYREGEEEERRQREYESWSQRQKDQERAKRVSQHRSKTIISSPSPLSRSVPLPMEPTYNSPRPYLQDTRSANRPTPRKSATMETSSSSEAYLAYDSRASTHHHSASNSTMASASSFLKLPYRAAMRETVYEDDYEEPAEEGESSDSDGFGGKRYAGDEEYRHHHPSRETTTLDTSPMAKCADCGDHLRFDDLITHFCVSLSDCKSPLFSQPPTPGLEGTHGAAEHSRNPFLEKYSEIVEKSGSPFLGHQQLEKVASSALPSPTEDYFGGNSVATRRMYTESASPEAASTSQRVEQLRKDRIKQIEEQRAAKKLQTSGLDISKTEGPSSSLWKEPKAMRRSPFATQTHVRGTNSTSTSSSSMSSSKSSVFEASRYLTGQTSSADITPSSSFENFDAVERSEKRERRSAVKLGSKAAQTTKTTMTTATERDSNKSTPKKPATFDLAGIQDLLQDIYADETSLSRNRQGREVLGKVSPRKGPHPPEIKLPSKEIRRPKVKKTCAVCLQTFAKNQPMVEKDGKILCIDDYAELYLEKCRKCRLPVRDVGVRSQDGALTGIYHRNCLSCFDCNAAFEDQTFYVFENSPYCGLHYHRLNGTICNSCHEGIEGECRQLETGERFHSNCLTCQYDDGTEFCKDTLKDFYLIKSERLCEWHYQRLQLETQEHGLGLADLKASKRRTKMGTVSARKGKA
ncbi:hypothetical protein CBS101457_006098 [Exobasidium rhododendri]|nr:hypothetical protein CBS101457_006098 [Exobasidium rhododendri]